MCQECGCIGSCRPDTHRYPGEGDKRGPPTEVGGSDDRGVESSPKPVGGETKQPVGAPHSDRTGRDIADPGDWRRKGDVEPQPHPLAADVDALRSPSLPSWEGRSGGAVKGGKPADLNCVNVGAVIGDVAPPWPGEDRDCGVTQIGA